MSKEGKYMFLFYFVACLFVFFVGAISVLQLRQIGVCLCVMCLEETKLMVGAISEKCLSPYE